MDGYNRFHKRIFSGMCFKTEWLELNIKGEIIIFWKLLSWLLRVCIIHLGIYQLSVSICQS
jgi:hypothetical protein